MNKKYFFLPVLIIFILIIASCLGQRQRRTPIIPVPDTEFFNFTLPIKMEDIIETGGGAGARVMPQWLRAYINGGIEETEKIPAYNDKYVFIGRSEGLNFTAMSKWAEYFSPSKDTIMLVARRVENKLVSSASLYPDDEYGAYFRTLIVNAYSTVYPGAVKEDTYWIRMRVDDEEEGSAQLFVFFVLISIEKELLQETIQDMLSKSMPSSRLSSAQRNAIERMNRNFFEGF